MFCIALEISGCKQLEKTESEFIAGLWEAVEAAAGIRAGRRFRAADDYFVFVFNAQDSGEARQVLDAACAVKEVLAAEREHLAGFLMLAEFFPAATQQDAAVRSLRALSALHEIDDSLLLGPAGAELFLPYCETEKDGEWVRVISRIPEGGPKLGSAAEFCLRPPVRDALQTRLASYMDCAEPPKVFFAYGPPLSGIRYQIDSALKNLGAFPCCRLYPLPGQILPALELPGFEQVPSVLSSAEKELWQEKKDIFGSRKIMDFPFEEALSAYSLAITAYIRLCERGLAPAVLVCEEFHAVHETAKKFLALIFRRGLPGWKLLPVCISRENDPGGDFADIPVEKYGLPAVDAGEIHSLLEAHLPDKKTGTAPLPGEPASGEASGFSASAGIQALYFEFLAGEAETETGGNSGYLREFRSLVRFLRTQDNSLREVLYIIHEAAGLLSASRLEELLLRLDFTPVRCGGIIRQLAGMGLIRDTKSLLPMFPELRRFLRKDALPRKTKITTELASFLHSVWKETPCGGETLLLEFYAENRRPEPLTEVFRNYAEALLDAGNTEEARKLLDTKFPVMLSSGMKLASASARLRLALAADNKEETAAAFSRMDEGGQDGPYYGESLIQKTLYWLKSGSPKEALSCAKNAVMLFQENPREGSLGMAHNAVGLAILAAGNPEQALDYFLMARESEAGSIRVLFLEGVCRFILGGYTQALGNFNRAAELADSRRARRWNTAARFMEGRILFELGEYEQAGGIFQTLLSGAAAFQYPEPVPVVYAWLARCLVYRGGADAAVRILDKYGGEYEAGFFRAEADYFRKEYSQARDRLETLAAAPYPGSFFFGDMPAWKDGFAFAENICIGRQSGSFLLPNLVRFFHAYLCGLDGENPAGIEMMSRLLRDEKISRGDPFLRLYYYWYFRILPPRQNPAFEDRQTILGRAIQNLQSRTSKLDSSAHKKAFTGKNVWNRLLMEEARQNNLV